MSRRENKKYYLSSLSLFLLSSVNMMKPSAVAAAFSSSSSSGSSRLALLSTTSSSTLPLASRIINRGAIITSSSSLSMINRYGIMWNQGETTPATKNNRAFYSSLFVSSSTSNKNKNNDKNTLLYQAASDSDSEDENDMSKTLDSTWDIAGLRKETDRQTQRCLKKIIKANARLNTAKKTVENLRNKEDPTLEELEACPNLELYESEVGELKTRMQDLNKLEEYLTDPDGLGKIKKKKEMQLPEEVASLALQLGVNDTPPKPQVRKKKKKVSNNNNGPRLPYRRYFTKDNTEIRVGKQAEDNDELSCNPKYRDGQDWWMHASGCPGSHVVIRCHDQKLDEDVVMDAASLAARQSKCGGANIKVSLTRCRDVKKPPGAKAGLVSLVGNVRTITVNMKEAEKTLERLDKTVLVN